MNTVNIALLLGPRVGTESELLSFVLGYLLCIASY